MADYRKLTQLLPLLEVESEEIRAKICHELAHFGPCLRDYVDHSGLTLSPQQMFGVEEALHLHYHSVWCNFWFEWFEISNPYQKLERGLDYISGIIGTREPLVPLKVLLDGVIKTFFVKGYQADADGLRRFLFEDYGLEGETRNYYNPLNCDIRYVLEQKKGMAVTLVTVYMILGHRLGLEIEGYNLPGHFMAVWRKGGKKHYVDCFRGGRVSDPMEIAQLAMVDLNDIHQRIDEPATPEIIIARIMQNLLYSYQHEGLPHKAHAVENLRNAFDHARKRFTENKLALIQNATKPLYRPGDVIQHRRYGYRGVVVDMDAVFLASEKWYRGNLTQPRKNQPWYHVLVDESAMSTYAAQENLIPDPCGKRVNHPLLSMFFDDFVRGTYLRNKEPWSLHE